MKKLLTIFSALLLLLSALSGCSRGTADGEFVVRDGRNGPVAARIRITPSEEWTSHDAQLSIGNGKHAIYFTFEGTGAADFRSFRFD